MSKPTKKSYPGIPLSEQEKESDFLMPDFDDDGNGKDDAKKGDVYKTDEGDKLLLDQHDPKFRKPKAIKIKDKPVTTKALVLRKPSPTARVSRPVAGYVMIPYILLKFGMQKGGFRVLRVVEKGGNYLYDKAVK